MKETVRCKKCNVKLPSYLKQMFTCKCDNVYCSLHKLNHDCDFNYREVKKVEKIQKSKVEQI